MAEVLRVVVPPEAEGERVDRFLATASGRSRTEVARAIAAGRVRANGRPVAKPAERVVAGLTLEVEFPPPPPSRAEPEPIPLHVVYEDDHLLVLDKPAGLVVHPAAGHARGTLVNAILHHAGHLPGDPGRPGIVHRLDKDTSGLMVVAKTETARERLVAALRERTLGRVYVAVATRGPVTPAAGVIRLPIGRDPRNRKRFWTVAAGREAVTHYRVLANGPRPVLLCRLETGRTHQIRVHLAALGHPLVGDELYGGGRGGQWLHALLLHLRHPATGEALVFCRPPTGPMAEHLASVGWDGARLCAAARTMVGGPTDGRDAAAADEEGGRGGRRG
jgi:23S rRNA pseudouridine1911/1915/1917 synthase